ncbi:sirohydrochlorin chelatase [Haliangium sp.]|uniref:sirohydrochlorin chelatase n=1 Tax=Haliangium sp. TaxID=2663208 RepID=UPI003D0BE91D
MANTSWLLIAHGSRDPAWARPFERLAAAVGARLAFMELGGPTVAEAVAEAVAAGAEHIRVLPLFMAVGRHVKHDIPASVEAARAAHPGVRIELLASLGESERFWAALGDLVRAELES